MSKKLPEGWKEYKLRDLAIVSSGQGAPQRDEHYGTDGLPFIKAGSLEELCKLNNEDKLKKINEQVAEEHKLKIFKKDTIVFAKSGMSCMKNRIYRMNKDCYVVNHLACISCKDKSIIDSKYLTYLFRYNPPSRLIKDESYPSIRLSDIENMIIYVPEIKEQERIVSVLEKAENAIEKRESSNKLLDELAKSKFIEMFGKGDYPIVKAEDVCEYITKGTTPKGNEIFEEYADGFIPYLKVYNLSFDGTMLFNEKPQYVKSEIHNVFLARSKVYPNDVLMNIVGPPLGKFSIVPDTFKEWNINQAIAIFRATDKIKPIFLLHALKQPNVLRPFIDSAVGVRQQNLSLLQCRNLEIPLPPIELQNKFVEFVKQVDKLKFEMENSLKELEYNFNSLMQKAFNGEL